MKPAMNAMSASTAAAGETSGRVERVHLAVSAGATAAGFALVSPHFALSLAAAALFETYNYHQLVRGTKAMFEGTARGAAGFRFALVLGFVALAIWVGAHPIGLLVGLSLIMPVMLIDAWRNRPAIEVGAPALDPDDPSWDQWNPWLARDRDEEETSE